MKAKHVVIASLIAAWLGGGVFAAQYVAGGAYLGIHKTDPRKVERSTWLDYWRDYQDDKKERKRLQGSMGVAVFLVYAVPLLIILANSGKKRSLHGDARWATRKEIEQAGLLGQKGIILGRLGGRYLMMDEPKFVALFAPTRSGKGVGTIIPNLLNWSDSVVVTDIKGENYKVTSGFRAKCGQKVFVFAPFGLPSDKKEDKSFVSHRFNPLTYINRHPHFIVGELQAKGYMLYPRKDGTEGFFNDQARNLFVGLALYCVESKIPLSIGEILRRSNGGGHPKDFWQAVVDSGVAADNVTPLSENCLNALRQFVGTSENTMTSILATFNAPLGVFSTLSVDAATSGDDFDIRRLRHERMSVYVVIPPKRLAEASLLLNLFFSIVIDENTHVLPEDDKSIKYKCMLLMDEFPAAGRIDKFEKAVPYMAGYWLYALTIAQNQSQLRAREMYGEEGTRTLLANHVVQILYQPVEQREAQEYSEILGYATEKGVSRGTSHGKGSSSRSENVSDQKRALLLPQELREIGPDKVIVLSDNCKPIFGEKIRYYVDKVFMERLMPPTEVKPMDVDTHYARIEGRVRDLKPGERVDPSKLVMDVATMPAVSNTDKPVASEVTAMADWLFSNIKWPQAGGSGANATNGLVMESAT